MILVALLWVVFGQSVAEDNRCSNRPEGDYPVACLGSKPDRSLTSKNWLLFEAKDAKGVPIEPVTQFLADGMILPLTIRHGYSVLRLCNGALAPQIFSSTRFKFDARRTYAKSQKGCGKAINDAVQIIESFFRPSVEWELEDSYPARLKLTNPNGLVYRFIEDGTFGADW